jgi:hypothetical protein
VDLKNILNGQIDARLRIKFLFFSRTWRKNIVKFNGWSFHYDLVSGGGNIGSVNVGPQTVTQSSTSTTPDTSRASTNVASGQTPMGLSEPQVPLMQLAYLSPTTSEGSDAGPPKNSGTPFSFDSGAVQSMFYDDLCCAKAGGACSPTGTPRCCPDSVCSVPTGSDAGTCQVQCQAQGGHCSVDNDCCQPKMMTQAAKCGEFNTCVECSNPGGACTSQSDCCVNGTICDTNPMSGTFHTCGFPIP